MTACRISCPLRRLAGMRVTVALVVVALLGVACGSDGEAADDGPCDLDPVATPVPGGHGGLLFDAHVHVDRRELVASLSCSMQRERVEAAVVHTFMDPADPLSSQGDYLTARRDHDARFVPAFHVDPASPADMTAGRVTAVLNEAGLLFVGIGEIDFHESPWAGTSLLAEPWPGLFELADERDLFLVVDVRSDQAAELRRMLDRFPDTKVLVVGRSLRAALPDLLREHDNLFVTLTVSAMLPVGAAAGPDEFVERFDAEWEARLARAGEEWLPVVRAAPGRVTWGSDATVAWHGDAEVYGRFAAFTRAFLDTLPRSVRGDVALNNARRLFGIPVPRQPDA